MKKILLTAALLLSLGSCSKNEYKTYDGPFFFYFDLSKSSTITINEAGTMNAEYYVHYTGPQASRTNIVSFSVTPGDGLVEGVDYTVTTAGGALNFMPGFTDLPIRIKWLPHDIDPSKNNTVTIRLENVDDDSFVLGLPGPDNSNYSKSLRQIIISKYQN